MYNFWIEKHISETILLTYTSHKFSSNECRKFINNVNLFTSKDLSKKIEVILSANSSVHSNFQITNDLFYANVV